MREIQVKVLDPRLEGQAQRFFAEAQITGQLQHPNIVPVHELGFTEANRAYFTMKRVRGRTLGALLADEQLSQLELLHRADLRRDGWAAVGPVRCRGRRRAARR